MNKKVIYTVNVGDYDHPPTPARENQDWDKVLVTDSSEPQHPGWTRVIKIPESDDPSRESRRVKWLPEDYIGGYDLYCYHDANIQIVRQILNKPFFITHPKRNSVLQEVHALKYYPTKVHYKSAQNQLAHYTSCGFPDDVGLFQNGLFCVDRSEELRKVREMVVNHLKHTTRDQLSLPYALWRLRCSPDVLGYQYFQYISRMTPHKLNRILTDRSTSVKVHHITPGRSDKNYGRAVNQLVSPLPTEDWICLRDMDTIPLHPEQFIQTCEKIAAENAAQLVSCYTNRLGLKHQLYKQTFRHNTDLSKEFPISKDLYEKHGSEIELTDEPIAGLMMLFPKYLWDDVGGLREGGIIFGNQYIDNEFYQRAKFHGYKVGLAKGIYLFHLYRMGKHKKDVEHLI